MCICCCQIENGLVVGLVTSSNVNKELQNAVGDFTTPGITYAVPADVVEYYLEYNSKGKVIGPLNFVIFPNRNGLEIKFNSVLNEL